MGAGDRGESAAALVLEKQKFGIGTLALERQIRANLTGNAEFTASLRDYAGAPGRDVTLAGQLGFTWWLNRNLGLTTRLRHERLTSTLRGRDYTTNSAFLGLKLQR